MIKKLFNWYLSPSLKPIVEEIDLYTKISELEQRILDLENENVETSNVLYELGNSIDAVDSRIDILVAEDWVDKPDKIN